MNWRKMLPLYAPAGLAWSSPSTHGRSRLLLSLPAQPPMPNFAGIPESLCPLRAILVTVPLHCAPGISYFSYKFLEMLHLPLPTQTDLPRPSCQVLISPLNITAALEHVWIN